MKTTWQFAIGIGEAFHLRREPVLEEPYGRSSRRERSATFGRGRDATEASPDPSGVLAPGRSWVVGALNRDVDDGASHRGPSNTSAERRSVTRTAFASEARRWPQVCFGNMQLLVAY